MKLTTRNTPYYVEKGGIVEMNSLNFIDFHFCQEIAMLIVCRNQSRKDVNTKIKRLQLLMAS